MTIPTDIKYTKDHEWVRIEGKIAVMGITDHAASELGDITFIELPVTGKKIKASDTVSTVESVKAASDIYAPIGGKIIEANTSLHDTPELINSAPYGEGWICKIEGFDQNEINNLMTSDEYEKLL